MTPKPQSQRHHRLSTCHRHPSLEPLTGLCATCLRERLAGMDPDTHQETPVPHLAAELCRSKSYSSSSNPNASSSSATSTATTVTTSEPRRKSCDVGSHRTLSDLFHSDDGRKNYKAKLKGLELGPIMKEGEKSVAEVWVPTLNINDMEAHVEVEFFEEDEDGEFKTMKEFIELELEKKNGGKDFRSLWEAASVSFGNRLARWQRKEHKKKKKEGSMDMEKPSARNLRDTQSEVGEYGFGRRSWDTDPRLSVDVRRLSVDDTRYSFDEPRASCDGCLISKTHPRLVPLVSVTEDMKAPSNGEENANDNAGVDNGGESSPGGQAQTRDYYSAERRRGSFDRSCSNKRVEPGDAELKSVMNSKVSPETMELFHGAKLLVTEKELRDSNWYSLKDHGAESISSLSKDAGSIATEADRKVIKFKKFHRWCNAWNNWGLLQRRNEIKCGDEEGHHGGDVVNSPVPESGHKLRGVTNGEADEAVSQKLTRTYTVKARGANPMDCGDSVIETKETDVKRIAELMLQRNQSVRFSPNNLDNGLLKFYLTPSRTGRKSTSGKASRLKNSDSKGRNSL